MCEKNKRLVEKIDQSRQPNKKRHHMPNMLRKTRMTMMTLTSSGVFQKSASPHRLALWVSRVLPNWNKSCAGTPDATYNEVACFPASQKGKREDELHTWIDCV